MLFKQWLQSSTVRLALIALVLCGVTLVGSRSTGEAKAAQMKSETVSQIEQHTTLAVEIIPSATSGDIRVTCVPDSVTMGVDGFASIHSAACPGAGAIQYFDVYKNPKMASQVLAMALSAQARGKTINIFYNTDDTSGVIDPTNRRKITGLGVDN